ncbi:MAG: hypothetical protein WDN49_11580 [Acetobacteraceae bacterium]
MVICAEVLAATFLPRSALKSAKPGRAQQPSLPGGVVDISEEIEARIAPRHFRDGGDAAQIAERDRPRGQRRNAVARGRDVLQLGVDPLLLEEPLVDREHDGDLTPPGVRCGDIQLRRLRRGRTAEQQRARERPEEHPQLHLKTSPVAQPRPAKRPARTRGHD